MLGVNADSGPGLRAGRSGSEPLLPSDDRANKWGQPRSNLVLIGFMGTGKSTVGALCAQYLGFEFCDADSLIVERASRTIPEIFAREGESGFRARERGVIAELAAGERRVIATGGGAILDDTNAACLRSAGRIAMLQARPETILSRIGETASRPLLGGTSNPAERVAGLLTQRAPAYTGNAERCFETDELSPVQVADAVVAWFRGELSGAENVDVELFERSYRIVIEDGAIASGAAARHIIDSVAGDRVFIVTHPQLLGPYAEPIAARLKRSGVSVSMLSIPPGERYKTLKTVSSLYDAFIEAHLDRKSIVIAVGGGVLGDTVGFAAATYLRGIRIVQIPTTLLAQVDSSVGGKTGIDLRAGKNLIGAFHQPSMVLIDTSTLATLPTRELRSGLAEVVKYGIIYDASFFAKIGADMPSLHRRERKPLLQMILRSCQIKAEVVAQDETEQGLRAILNFGHTVGHALESITFYRRYKHGEAISIGMVTASLIGEALGVTPPSVTQAICRTLAAAKLPIGFPTDIDAGQVLDAAQRDKKTESGKLRFVLARSIGDAYLHNDVPTAAIIEAIERHRNGDFLNG